MRSALHRLLLPLEGAFDHLHATATQCSTVRQILCHEMLTRQTSFWAWGIEEWQEIITTGQSAFVARYGWTSQGRSGRQQVCAVAYLLTPSLPLFPLLQNIHYSPIAKKVFGAQVIDTCTDQMIETLKSWGYQNPIRKAIAACLSYFFLRNRSSRLEDLSKEFLEQTLAEDTFNRVQIYSFQISRALFAQGILAEPLELRTGMKSYAADAAREDGSIDRQWLEWCERWRRQSTRRDRDGVFYPLLQIGRWLKVHHPEVSSPKDFTYELAAELVASILHWKVGDWGTRRGRRQEDIGKPFRPHAKGAVLNAVRTFLQNCQEWEWIPVTLNVVRAFRTPPSLRRLMGPDPRIIDKEIWANLSGQR